jgi:hypothetical protein
MELQERGLRFDVIAKAVKERKDDLYGVVYVARLSREEQSP